MEEIYEKIKELDNIIEEKNLILKNFLNKTLLGYLDHNTDIAIEKVINVTKWQIEIIEDDIIKNLKIYYSLNKEKTSNEYKTITSLLAKRVVNGSISIEDAMEISGKTKKNQKNKA